MSHRHDTEKIASELVAEMAHMPVIDSHEHLPTEKTLLAQTPDVLTRIFCHYSVTQAASAGLPGDRLELKNTDISLEERWKRFSPFLDAIRDTGYARAAQLTARDLFGVEDINDQTYLELSDKIRQTNTPGIYDRILRERCHIERVLNQGSWHDGPGGYALGVFRGFMGIVNQLETVRSSMRDIIGNVKAPSDWIDQWLGNLVKEGYVGLKFAAALPKECPDDTEGKKLFDVFRESSLEPEQKRLFGAWVIHKAIELAPRHNLTVAVHCGLVWCCWNSFEELNPMGLIPLILKYRATTFDLYHGGIPWVRETAVIGNQYPNVNLNLIWCHQISPYMTETMLNEWIDLVPATKIIGFGGDNCDGPEKTLGVLCMARENIARALAIRVARGQMTESRALDVCHLWLYDNPKRIYGI